MERPSDSDSDDDECYRRLGSLVLRPTITSLPSIGDDNDTDGGDSSSDTEVVFSNINWAAQESTGLLFDQEPGSPGPLRPETDGNAPTGARPLSGAIGTTAVHSPPGPQPSVAASPRHGLTAANTVALDHAVGSPSGAPKRVGPPTPSVTSTPPPVAGGEGAGAGHVWDDDPDEPYEGRGWLSGAAGRLANVAERRRANAAATDEEHVAAAARHAAAFRQHRQQLQQQQQPPLNALADSGAAADDTSELASPSAAATAASSGALEQQQQQLQREREEVERRILRDFQEAIRAADSEPPLVASSGLSLESTVAGLGLEDLDALIARLAAGTADLRPPGGEGAAAGSCSAATAAEPGATASARPWALEPLPAADSLWSDEEDEAVGAATAGGGQAGRAAGVTAAVERVARVSPEWGPPAAAAVGGELPAPAATPVSAPTVIAPSAASAPAAAAPSPPAIALPTGAPPGPPHLPGPLPAKFKFFAGPGVPVAAPPLPAVAGGGSAGSGPIVQDLRQSIVEAAQRSSRDAAAVAAQRQSEAKAAAARRRLVVDSDSSDDGSGDDDGAVARKVRPVPPGQAPPPAPSQPPPPQPPPPQQQQPAAPAAPAVRPRPAAPTAAATGALSTTTTAASTTEHAGRAVARFPPSDWSESSAEVTLGGCGGAAPAAPRCATVGTDAADLRPASRSVFVCTSERKAEEEERVQDIREYLKARAAAAAAAARAEAEAEAEQQRQRAPQEPPAERRWPEPPAAVTERIAVLAERQAAAASTAAAAAAEAQKPAKPRAVATFAGGDNDGRGLANGTSGGSTAKDAAAASANGNGTATAAAAATAEAAMSPAASAASGPRSFAACSTEGDEDLVAEPPPASVSDASAERGARMAAAGTVIPLARAPAAPSSAGSASRGAVATSAASTTARSETASVDPASKRSVAAATAAPAPARGAAPGAPSVAAVGVTPGATRPAALQLPSPVSASADAAVAASAVAYVSPVGLSPASAAAAAAAAAAAPAKSPGAGAPADLCRLPAWLPQGSCFTLMLTSPRNLPGREVGAALEWLLLRQPSLPAFSVVGARLLAVPQSWPLLPAAAAVKQPPCPASAGVPRAGGGGSGGGSGSAGDAVRVLAVACVPRAGVDADAYSHELPATAAADAEAAGSTARRLTEALAALPWAAIFATAHGDESCPAGTGQGCGALLGGWVSTQPGAQLLFSPLRLPPHAFSHHQPRASCSTVTPSATAVTSPNGAAAAAADAPGSTTFVSVVTAGGLKDPHLVRRLLERAACLGLTLRGLQVVYATEEAAAAVVASTPHRPLPYTGAAVLALSGRNDPLRRWQAQLGPPEARLACRTDPTSLHALYGNVAQHITCSYDGASAARELTALFSVAVGGGDGQPPASSPSPSPRQQQQQLRLAPAPAMPAPQRGVAGDAPAATAAAAVCGLAASGQPEAQWLALPACGAAQQERALWCLQRLLWCGYGLRGLLLMRLPSEPQPAPARARAPHWQSQEQSPALVLEVSKEEATDQLPLLLAAVPPPPPASGKIAAAGCPPPAVRSLLAPDALRARLAPSDVQSLPQPYVAEQLLVAAAGDAALDPADDDGGGGDGGGLSAAAAPLHFHHGEDGIAVVALQARPLHAATLLLAALVSRATGGAAAAAAAAAPELPSADRLELVACRYLRQVPSDVANCLAVLHPYHLGAPAAAPAAASAAVPATGTAGGVGASARAGSQRLVISQPALLAVFHGPAAQARVTRWLATGLQRLHGAPDQSTTTATASAGDQDAVWATLLDQLHRDYPPVAALAVASPAVAAVSGSQAAAKRALSYGFGPAHVFLDAGLHNGLHRPPLQPPVAPSAAAAAAAVVATPLFRLLAGPEPLPAVVALDFAALHRNLLPRLLKQLWREGYSLHAAATCRVQPGGGAAAAMPALSGKPAVVLHVSRSNAVQHLRAMASALAAGGGGLLTCATWRDAVAVVAEVWPQRPPADAEGQAAAGAGVVLAHRGAAAAAGPARRFVRPEGSRLLQLTAMVVTPAVPSSGTGTATPSLDWPRLADALEALHSEGFRLGAVRAAAATPRDLADLGRVSCRVSPAQQYAVHASAAAPAPAAASAAAVAPPPPCNLVLLALARDCAVTTLQVLLDEASRAAAAAELRQGQGQGSAAAAAAAAGSGGVLPAAMAGRGPTGGRREAVTALAALAPCVSVAHSPAAAEAQVVAVFDDVFGAGGVALLQ